MSPDVNDVQRSTPPAAATRSVAVSPPSRVRRPQPAATRYASPDEAFNIVDRVTLSPEARALSRRDQITLDLQADQERVRQLTYIGQREPAPLPTLPVDSD